jgi:hypothetical protein
MQLGIEDVAEAVRQCRAQGVRRYPEALWGQIGELCRGQSVADVSRRIGISAQYLERRIGPKSNRGRFCELKIESPAGARSERSLLAVRRRDGSEMAIELVGTVDICRAIAEFMR